MAAKKCDHRRYWNIYWALNRSHCRAEEMLCKKCGKKIMLSFHGKEAFDNNKLLGAFNMLQWLSSAFFIVSLALIFGIHNPLVAIGAILAVTLYHFVCFYYIIKGPSLIIKEKRKGLFAKK